MYSTFEILSSVQLIFCLLVLVPSTNNLGIWKSIRKNRINVSRYCHNPLSSPCPCLKKMKFEHLFTIPKTDYSIAHQGTRRPGNLWFGSVQESLVYFSPLPFPEVVMENKLRTKHIIDHLKFENAKSVTCCFRYFFFRLYDIISRSRKYSTLNFIPICYRRT